QRDGAVVHVPGARGAAAGGGAGSPGRGPHSFLGIVGGELHGRSIPALAHGRDVFGADAVDDALLVGAAPGIGVFAEVLLRHLVDVGVGAFVGLFDYPPTNLDVAVGVRRVVNGNRDAAIAIEVADLLAAFGGVEHQVIP